MSIQFILETAIHSLLNEFISEPFSFFTEGDAVVHFCQILAQESSVNRFVPTADGHNVALVHHEYPTFFRFDDHNPIAKLPSPARRGHYDLVILNSGFVAAHPAEVITNRDIDEIPVSAVVPFQAVIEFKLHSRGCSKRRSQGVIWELGKLALSAEDAPLRYLVVLQRYPSTHLYKWDEHWSKVVQAADARKDEIRSVMITHWLVLDRKPEQQWFGDWLVKG
jgi:hypothetical protein